jgi:hypothetical protein
MVARKKDVQTLIKGRRARLDVTPNRSVPAVPSRSKEKRASSIVAPSLAVPASPSSQDRAGQMRTVALRAAAGADPSLSLPASHAPDDAHCGSARREATLSAGAGQTLAGAHGACARTSTPKRRKGPGEVGAPMRNADASPLSGTEGQKPCDTHGRFADGSALSESRASGDVPPINRLPGSPPSDDERANIHVMTRFCMPAPSSSILVIRELARQRTDLLRAWQRLNNQIKAIERRGQSAGANHFPDAAPSIADSAAPALVHCVDTTMAARKAVEKQLDKLAKSLPVYATFTKPTKGLGAGGLALIIGETGDLSLYANPAKVWKRMGLAVFDGVRQRRVAGNAEEAIRQGYSSHRRQIMWNIGDSMIKVGDTYRQVYLDRKAYELAKNPDAKPIVNHRRAQRYMEKRILRDLWRAWRDLHGVAA